MKIGVSPHKPRQRSFEPAFLLRVTGPRGMTHLFRSLVRTSVFTSSRSAQEAARARPDRAAHVTRANPSGPLSSCIPGPGMDAVSRRRIVRAGRGTTEPHAGHVHCAWQQDRDARRGAAGVRPGARRSGLAMTRLRVVRAGLQRRFPTSTPSGRGRRYPTAPIRPGPFPGGAIR